MAIRTWQSEYSLKHAQEEALDTLQVIESKTVTNEYAGKTSSYTEYLCETFAGRVVALSSSVERIMSDVWATLFYAIVMVDEGEYRELCYGNDDCGATRNSAEIDATAEQISMYVSWRKAEDDRFAAEQEAIERARREARAEMDRKAVKKGRTLRVVRGRKVKKGTEGRCFWVGESQWGKRVGMTLANGETVWIDARNVEAIAE
jgi:hypothetical protein